MDYDSFKGFDHGVNKMNLSHLVKVAANTIEMRPTEIHHKANGTATDKPSFTIVMARLKEDIPVDIILPNVIVYGQVSLDMLNRALGEIGYEITKIKR